MALSASQLSRVARPTRKLEKLRPLKISNQNRHSTIDPRMGTVEDIMNLADVVASHLVNGNFDSNLQHNIKSLHSVLKACGSKLEAIYKDQLDRTFVTFRNGCRNESLDYVSRLCLLELIELRASQWAPQQLNSYYKHKLNHSDLEIVTTPVIDNLFMQPALFAISPTSASVPPPLLLGPGEILKSSGKYPAPTKVVGKNYCKDEVVIRNSDSGKVMGIKGRRVHMIEELSETVISFQRVNPGAKERLVQITGPSEDKIIYAKQLMEDTIRRNASPVRVDSEGDRLGSSSSLNSSTSDDSLLPLPAGTKRSSLLHSYSTNDATLGEYKYTVTVGNDSIKVTGSNLELVRIAKLVLDEYFSPDVTDDALYQEEDGQDVFETADSITSPVTPNSELTIDTEVIVESAALSSKPETADDTSTLPTDLRSYSREFLIQLVDSPFSVELPAAWPRVVRDFSYILKKTPIDRLVAADLLVPRTKEPSPSLTEQSAKSATP